MNGRLRKWLENYRRLDAAVLYMRFFMGGVLLLHNIGKLQVYNEIINSYPALFHIDNRSSFVLIALAQTLLAVLLLIGLKVRFAAALLAAGFAYALWRNGIDVAGEVRFLWIGICLFLCISGGGAYSADALQPAGGEGGES